MIISVGGKSAYTITHTEKHNMKPRLIDNLLRTDLALSPYDLEAKYDHLFLTPELDSIGLVLNVIVDELYQSTTFTYSDYINLADNTIKDIKKTKDCIHKTVILTFLKHYQTIFFELLKEAKKHKGFNHAN